MEKSKAEGSNPLATVEEIQRRLVRPPSLHSQPSTSSTRARQDITSCYSSQFGVNSTEFQNKKRAKGREETKKRIEDYLDPALLSATRAKIGGKRKRGGGEMRVKMRVKEAEFEWPVDELKVLTEGLRSEKVTKKWRFDEAVDLGDDVDVIRVVGGDDEDEVWCTPFQRFEKTALKRFFNGCEG